MARYEAVVMVPVKLEVDATSLNYAKHLFRQKVASFEKVDEKYDARLLTITLPEIEDQPPPPAVG